jgi:competence protein ComGC
MKNKISKLNFEKAFTLVELLVSITITVIIIIPLLVFITDISSEI